MYAQLILIEAFSPRNAFQNLFCLLTVLNCRQPDVRSEPDTFLPSAPAHCDLGGVTLHHHQVPLPPGLIPVCLHWAVYRPGYLLCQILSKLPHQRFYRLQNQKNSHKSSTRIHTDLDVSFITVMIVMSNVFITIDFEVNSHNFELASKDY